MAIGLPGQAVLEAGIYLIPLARGRLRSLYCSSIRSYSRPLQPAWLAEAPPYPTHEERVYWTNCPCVKQCSGSRSVFSPFPSHSSSASSRLSFYRVTFFLL
ncbi:unnamed protein product [Protopolystoma xenopodis]|uniref:Uncharacterized protein n=1 Tax=Protopolystoma xenopodis TaxID=117903 RepID=A0A3S5AME6_9PLAT|nr:unnamed protein product [Protopolystoma xenopodis]